MSSTIPTQFQTIRAKRGITFSSFLVSVLLLCFVFVFLILTGPLSLCTEKYVIFSGSTSAACTTTTTTFDSPTNLEHLVFGIQGSENTFHLRKSYVESWWRPGKTRGYVYLDRAPRGNLLPWSEKSPPYRINDDISELMAEIKPVMPQMPRIFHGILELFREEQQGMRWLILGDDDSIFFLDNLVDVLSKYDHTQYYYIGYPSEYVKSNYWFSFRMGFGGGGIILSCPLVEALVNDMDRCLRTYSNFSSDLMVMACLADFGVNLTPHRGFHQMDFRGDVSGFLSSHPKDLALSLHHIDAVDSYFPSMGRLESLRHLMKAGDVDQSRLFQQTICYRRDRNWSISVSWGYSAHIYEKVMPRSWLMTPIETFKSWRRGRKPPQYMFDTRIPSGDPCEAPHIFYLESVEKFWSKNEILTVYSRLKPRNLSACDSGGSNHSAEFISKIHVYSPAIKRIEIGRPECCDVVGVHETGKVDVKFRECMQHETIA